MPGTIPKGMTAVILFLGGPRTEQDPILVGFPPPQGSGTHP